MYFYFELHTVRKDLRRQGVSVSRMAVFLCAIWN